MIASDIRRLVLRASILLFASVLSTTAPAKDASGMYWGFGSGGFSCGKYLSDLSDLSEHAQICELARIAYLAWLQGYLSGFNAQTPGVYNILEGTDIDGAIGWVNNYCQQHPTDTFAIAAIKLTEFMMQKRRSEVSPPGREKQDLFADLIPPKPAPMSSYVGDIAPDRPVSFNAPAQHGMGKPKLGPPVEGNPFAAAPAPSDQFSPWNKNPAAMVSNLAGTGQPKLTPVEGNPYDQFDKKPAESAQAEPGLPAAKSEVVTVKYRGPVSLAAFKCDTITRSSFVERVCYDEKNAYMLINLSGTWYHYCEIDRGMVENLIAAESMGRYYNASIKGHFDCRTHRVPQY